MARLITDPNLARPDDVYQMLVDLLEGCDDEESRKRSARLILALANHIGDEAVLAEAAALARFDR
jgi:3-(3-hydroxy-phenyl)propionate hydroxylase